MKRISIAKTIGMLGMLATLSAFVGTGLHQTAKAQTQSQSEILAEQGLIPAFCATSYRTPEGEMVFPQQFYGEDGNFFFYEFIGIEFTPEQQAVYAQAKARLQERGDALGRNVKMVILPTDTISLVYGDGYPVEMDDELGNALTTVNVDNIPNTEQVDALNEKYGQYNVRFYIPGTLNLTPEQVLENRSIDRDFEFAMMSAFTPEQRAVYLENLDVKYAFASCDPDPSDG
jgi:hypothetical protein